MVLKIDPENEKISLGLKQTEPDPWETLAEKYPPGTVLQGKVRNLTNFGAFVEIEEGIDGLVHISDMSWTKRVRHPSEVVKKGDVVTVKVLEVNRENRRISLGIKQTMDDPWDDLAQEYTVGTGARRHGRAVAGRGVRRRAAIGVEVFVPVSHLLPDDIKKPAEYFGVSDRIPLRSQDGSGEPPHRALRARLHGRCDGRRSVGSTPSSGRSALPPRPKGTSSGPSGSPKSTTGRRSRRRHALIRAEFAGFSAEGWVPGTHPPADRKRRCSDGVGRAKAALGAARGAAFRGGWSGVWLVRSIPCSVECRAPRLRHLERRPTRQCGRLHAHLPERPSQSGVAARRVVRGSPSASRHSWREVALRALLRRARRENMRLDDERSRCATCRSPACQSASNRRLSGPQL